MSISEYSQSKFTSFEAYMLLKNTLVKLAVRIEMVDMSDFDETAFVMNFCIFKLFFKYAKPFFF